MSYRFPFNTYALPRSLSNIDSLQANLPDESLPPMTSVAKTGVYFGFAQVIAPDNEKGFTEDKTVFPMVMSLGWNPFYKNERLTAVRRSL